MTSTKKHKMDMENKLCVVTGATSGIGRATAYKLAASGAYLVLMARNEQKAMHVREELMAATNNSGIDIILADFNYQYEIREAASQLLSKFEKVDLLINNAGMMASKQEETLDGIERTIAVNHLGPFLLTNLLMPGLLKAEEARVVTVASRAHELGAIVFNTDDFQLARNYSPMKAYGLSKLYNIMFTYELARRYPFILTVSMHPGVIGTGLAGNARWYMKVFYTLGKPFMRSATKAAADIMYLATSDEIKGHSGTYFAHSKETKPAKVAFDETLTKYVWDESAKLTGLA